MATTTEQSHITRDAQILSGEPIIRGTRTPVRAVVELWRMGIPAEEIPSHLPHLNVSDVFHALSFFHDHADEVNQHIERNRVPDNLIDPSVKNL
jgi:uncharacterized protein (DUF433 family)